MNSILFQSLSLNRFARIKKYLILTVLPLLVVSLYSLPYLWNFILSGYEGRPFAPIERLLTRASMLIYYKNCRNIRGEILSGCCWSEGCSVTQQVKFHAFVC